MTREIDAHEWYAWRPVLCDDTGRFAWFRTVWRRREFLGPRTAKMGDLDLLIWRYYRSKPES